MCSGLKHKSVDPETGEVIERRVFFPRPQAQIPIIDQHGERLCQWGRRDPREDPESGSPITGWARLESLEKDYWRQHEPDYVLIPALEFAEKPSGFAKSVWYPPMLPDTYLMGLRMRKAQKEFIYVVTCEPETIFRDIDRVPLIVDRNFEHMDPLECDFEEAEAPRTKKKKTPQKSQQTSDIQLGLF